MPFRQQGEAPLSAVINVRVTADEKEHLQRQAQDAGLTVSRLARRRLLGRRVIASVDGTMIRELRRLGGLVKHVSNSNPGGYSAEARQALRALTAYITRLSGGGDSRGGGDDR